jgi:hypothetical protein
MKKSEFSVLAPATIAARTVLSAATLNPFSLAHVAPKSKCLSVQFQLRHYLKGFRRSCFGVSFAQSGVAFVPENLVH